MKLIIKKKEILFYSYQIITVIIIYDTFIRFILLSNILDHP